ncbi:MAG: hypothetical protein PHW76_05390 [Alphaproteobacteria bacterium]|nr:hypothetical protein [Alphaproteobacteria bacterium]
MTQSKKIAIGVAAFIAGFAVPVGAWVFWPYTEKNPELVTQLCSQLAEKGKECDREKVDRMIEKAMQAVSQAGKGER